MTTLEEKLGYTFQSPELLENALTHSSCANESRGKLQSNERLEFLGDSILGMVVADHLYRNHPDLPEGGADPHPLRPGVRGEPGGGGPGPGAGRVSEAGQGGRRPAAAATGPPSRQTP